MNKAELSARTAAENSPSRAGADDAVTPVFSTINDALANGQAVRAAAFGSFAKLSASRTGPHDLPDLLTVPRLEHAELRVVSVSRTPSIAGGQQLCSDNVTFDEETRASSGPRLHVVETEIASDPIPVCALGMDRIVTPPYEVAHFFKQSDRHTNLRGLGHAESLMSLGDARLRTTILHMAVRPETGPKIALSGRFAY